MLACGEQHRVNVCVSVVMRVSIWLETHTVRSCGVVLGI